MEVGKMKTWAIKYIDRADKSRTHIQEVEATSKTVALLTFMKQYPDCKVIDIKEAK